MMDYPTSVAVDSYDNIVVTGNTLSDDFPIINDFNESLSAFGDAFIAIFDSSGDLKWSSFLGGVGMDTGFAVAFDLTLIFCLAESGGGPPKSKLNWLFPLADISNYSLSNLNKNN